MKIPTEFKIVLFSFLIVIFSFQVNSQNSKMTLGLSPSFTRQEIIDSADDWIFWKKDLRNSEIVTHYGQTMEVENAYNMSQCKQVNYESPSPNIDSVSYISDGKTLNATVWFTSPVSEPSLNDTIDIYRENLKLHVKDLPPSSGDISLEKYANITIAKLNNPKHDFNLIDKNITTVGGVRAYSLVYDSLTSDGLKLKNMTVLAFKDNKVYDITYSAFEDKYPLYLPIIHKVIDSIRFINSASDFGNRSGDLIKDKNNNSQVVVPQNRNSFTKVNQPNNSSTYEFENLGIRLINPVGWSLQEKQRGNSDKTIILTSEFSDKKVERPSWHEMTLTMAIALDSPGDTGLTDYRVMLLRSQDSADKQWKWIREIREVSANDKTKVLENTSSNSFGEKGDHLPADYAVFSFPLDKVNFPQQYRVVFYVTDYFVKQHRLCRLVDTTNWVMIPPPEFTISTKPNSITLRPGEDGNVEVAIKGNVNIPTQAFMSEETRNNNISTGRHVDFLQNNIYIPPSSVGTSTLVIKLDDTTRPGSYTLPVKANVSFPTTVTNRGGESFSNSKAVSSIAESNLTLTVLPSFTSEERFNNFVNSWVSPISGVWTFMAGVAAVLAPLVLRVYNKRKKDNKDHHTIDESM